MEELIDIFPIPIALSPKKIAAAPSARKATSYASMAGTGGGPFFRIPKNPDGFLSAGSCAGGKGGRCRFSPTSVFPGASTARQFLHAFLKPSSKASSSWKHSGKCAAMPQATPSPSLYETVFSREHPKSALILHGFIRGQSSLQATFRGSGRQWRHSSSALWRVFQARNHPSFSTA